MPYYDGLSIEKILDFGKKYAQVANYLPEERDIHRLPRSFIVNIINTIVKDPFRSWVSDRIKERNEDIAVKRKLNIELDPAIAAAFRNSVNISSKYL